MPNRVLELKSLQHGQNDCSDRTALRMYCVSAAQVHGGHSTKKRMDLLGVHGFRGEGRGCSRVGRPIYGSRRLLDVNRFRSLLGWPRGKGFLPPMKITDAKVIVC